MRPRRKRMNPDTVQLLKHIVVGLFVITIVGLLITGVWFGTRIAALTITEVSASGGKTIDHTRVVQAVQETLAGTYLGLVPRRFAWFYPEEEIVAAVSKTERIFNVEVLRESGTSLTITYDEYVPIALWCTADADERCLFLDSEAYAFSSAPKLTGGSFIRYVTAGREPVTGEVAVPVAVYTDIQETVQLLTTEGWFVSQVEIDQVGDVFLAIVGGGELKIDLRETPLQIVENLRVLLASDEFKHLTPGNFQYIDLRFGNKVFVNEAPIRPEEASSTEASF